MKREYSKGYVTKDRKHWRAVINWQSPDGKQHRKTKNTNIRCYPDPIDMKTGTTLRTDNRGKATAEEFLRRWRDDLVKEQERKPSLIDETTRFYTYSELFLNMKEQAGSIRPVTIDNYKGFLKHLYGTELGNTTLEYLTAKKISSWLSYLKKEQGLSNTTISHLFIFYKSICAHAVKTGVLHTNPFNLVKAPKKNRKPINALDKTGIQKFNNSITPVISESFAIGAIIALRCGLRQGEVCALQWKDIDMESKIIHINNALSRSGGRYYIAPPKTKNSIRNIPFGDSLCSILRSRKFEQMEERSNLGLAWSQNVYVLGSAIDGTWKTPDVLGNEWRTFSRLINLRGTQGEYCTFHDLRHTFATHAVAEGIDIKTTSAILGHSNAAMTLNVYADALEDSKRDAMIELDTIFA